MSKSQVIGSIRMVRSCVRHMQAKVTIHQMSVKSAKEKRAISQEVLAACRQQAREKIPQLLGENQTGVLTNMTIQEVNDARKNSGPDASGFVINVSNMNNVKNNYVMCASLSLSHPFFPQAKNFHPPEIRSRLSAVMCHDTATADKFYVRHLNMEQSLEIRRLFEEATHGASAPGPSSTSLPEPRVPAKPRSDKRKRRVSVSESSSSEEEAEVPYQESGSSALEEEMEEITRARRRLAKKREGDGKEEEDDDDDDDEQEQEQGEKDQQEEEEEDQQQQEEEQQEEEDLKVRDFLTLFIFILCNSSFDL
ncbi:hypothetical protein XENOCAPTIV_026438 [Xenoophorus captivus]|uniref:Uncharacterized protein n=1 Tax=Xenoophorus captivus TaxID=1517983 RepID=A0ABV0QTK2_9TELE